MRSISLLLRHFKMGSSEWAAPNEAARKGAARKGEAQPDVMP